MPHSLRLGFMRGASPSRSAHCAPAPPRPDHRPRRRRHRDRSALSQRHAEQQRRRAHLRLSRPAQREVSSSIPGLAESSGRRVDPLTWEFKLRKGVKFHDGSEFTAADVVASIERVPTVPNSPSPFTAYTKQIKEMIVVDPYTIRFKTATPYPLMPSDMTQVAIISARRAKATHRGLQQRQGGDRHRPVQARALCQRRPHRARAQRRVLGRQDAVGESDAAPPAATTPRASRRCWPATCRRSSTCRRPTSRRIRADKRLNVYKVIADRLIYLHMDSDRDVSPFVTDKAGKPLAKNPLKDPRVRKAISKAINRPAIVDKVMEGEAVAAGQLLADGMFGTTRNLKVEPYDPDGREKAARRGRLSGRLRPDDSRAEQSLRQRRQDRAGGRADADARSASRPRSRRCRRRRSSRRRPISSSASCCWAGARAPAKRRRR